ncbi:MAG TPA: hypothetical protein VK615_15595, partial [Candidatus Binatia bacterium]|nr:hypothetical protein [Candidatus Binatia bacterium]
DTVRLKLNANTPMAPDTAYSLRVENVYDDCAGNAIDPNAVTPIVRFASPILRISSGYQWRFNDQGIDLGTSWILPNYMDSGWPLGPPVFDAHRVPRTTVSGQAIGTHTAVSNATGSQVPAHYFRTHFQFAGNPFGAALSLRPFVDDGAIFYLNGAEIFRLGVPPGAASYNTLANRTVTTANFEGPFIFCVPQLRQGDNVFAVEVHQASLASPDLTFAMEADLLLPNPSSRLQISLSSDGAQATVTWNGGGRLEATDNLADPNAWREIQNATSPYGPFAVSGTRFFRVQKP